MTIFTFVMLAVVIGGGVYLFLSSHYGEIIVGIALLSNGVNLLILESSHPVEGVVDPLPQALILTAIVIGFALIAFVSAFFILSIENGGNSEVQPIGEEEE